MRNDLHEEFKDVFDTSEQLKTMLGEPITIHLNENVQTFAISTTRSIPFAWRDEVKANLDQMTRQGIVKPLRDERVCLQHQIWVKIFTQHLTQNKGFDKYPLSP